MTSNSNWLKPNADEVAAKVIDGEAILINLSTGIYYSLDGVGAFIWECIEHGQSVDEILKSVLRRYKVDNGDADSDVRKLISQLCEEKLVSESSKLAPSTEPTAQFNGEKLTYEPPSLNVYRDMGDLLALDPPMPGLAEMSWEDQPDRSKE